MCAFNMPQSGMYLDTLYILIRLFVTHTTHPPVLSYGLCRAEFLSDARSTERGTHLIELDS